METTETMATPQQIATALRKLTAYVPRGVPPDATLALYARELVGVSYDRLLAGFGALKTENWFPSLGQILRATGKRIPNDEAIDAVCVNLAGFLLHRSPLCPAARTVFERSGGLDAFQHVGTGADPSREVRPAVVAVFDAGMVCSAADLEPPTPAPALPASTTPEPVQTLITQEQRQALARHIRVMADCLRHGRKPPPPLPELRPMEDAI